MKKNVYNEIIKKFKTKKILVIGDLVLDEYWYGKIERASREAPVLILDYEYKTPSLGGAANAINNIASLDAKVFAISAIGNDESSKTMFEIFRKKAVDLSGVILENYLHTSTKIRFMAGCLHTTKQQVLRLDKKSKEKLSLATEKKIIENLKKSLAKVDAVLISDYGLGTLTKRIIEFLNKEAKTKKIPFVLDSRYNLRDYKNITIAAPNEEEAARALEKSSIEKETAFADVKDLKNILKSDAGLITLGKEGMVLNFGKKCVKIDAVGSKESVDVTGAGDTVCAVLTLALASGADFEEASSLANAAASSVVMQRGTAVVTYNELCSLVDKYLS